MAAHEIDLQRLEIPWSNVYFREFAESGVDSVNDASFCNDAIHERARDRNALPGSFTELHLYACSGNGCDFIKGQWLSGKLQHGNGSESLEQVA
jgi:hypothetical protein